MSQSNGKQTIVRLCNRYLGNKPKTELPIVNTHVNEPKISLTQNWTKLKRKCKSNIWFIFTGSEREEYQRQAIIK